MSTAQPPTRPSDGGDDPSLLSRLLHALAHDLKTPLVSLRGFVELMQFRRYELPGPMGTWVDTMARSVLELQEALELLSAFARLDHLEGAADLPKALKGALWDEELASHRAFALRGDPMTVAMPEELFVLFARGVLRLLVRVDPGVEGTILGDWHREGDRVLVELRRTGGDARDLQRRYPVVLAKAASRKLAGDLEVVQEEEGVCVRWWLPAGEENA